MTEGTDKAELMEIITNSINKVVREIVSEVVTNSVNKVVLEIMADVIAEIDNINMKKVPGAKIKTSEDIFTELDENNEIKRVKGEWFSCYGSKSQ